MELLNRNSEDSILKGRFIKKVLRERGNEINEEVGKRTSSFASSLWSRRGISLTDDTLTYKSTKVHRFLDMKRRNTINGKKRKKNYPIHNKIIMGQYTQIIKDLTVGFTEEIKAELRSMGD
jgi:hypothetical protein